MEVVCQSCPCLVREGERIFDTYMPSFATISTSGLKDPLDIGRHVGGHTMLLVVCLPYPDN
jgi:hypothetical protein